MPGRKGRLRVRAWRAEAPAPRRLFALGGVWERREAEQTGLRGNKGVIVAVLCVMAEWVVEPSERSVFRGRSMMGAA